MLPYANSLSDETRKQFRIYAYASTWVGCFSDVMLESSAIIILYLAMLGASNTLIMLSTGLIGITSMCLLIPSSGIVDKIGPKRVVAVSCYIASFSYLLMAAAPFMGGDSSKYIVFTGCFLFCISRALCTTASTPIFGSILRPDERGDFFGFMRFSYSILTGTVFFLLGLFMGKEPPVWFLQIIIAATGILALGRNFFLSRIVLPEHEGGDYNLRSAFKISIRNGPLVSFAVYTCFLCLAFSAIQPLILIYLKNGLFCGDNVVQMISSVGIGGSICGFFFYGKIMRLLGIRNLQILVHIAYILIPLGLFFCGSGIPYLSVVIGILYFLGNFAFACFMCAFSQECLSLSRPGNITMANAFAQTYQMIGTASGRLVASLLLGNGVLAATWQMWSFSFSHYQTIFLLCSGGSLFCLILIFCIPSVIPEHDNYYCP